MKVFISWSGNKSHKVAMIFREWLPSVIQSLEPYVSSEDIDKGARWSSDIAKELEDSTFGILCVTKDNLHAPWLSFEAGALSKTMDKSFVTPFLFDIKRSEVNGPILQFQSTVFEKEDIKNILDIVKAEYNPKRLIFISFDYKNLIYLRELSDDLTLQYLCGCNVDVGLIEKLKRYEFDLDIEHSFLTEQNILKLHENSISVNCWTVDDKHRAEELVGWNADYITTNILEADGK